MSNALVRVLERVSEQVTPPGSKEGTRRTTRVLRFRRGQVVHEAAVKAYEERTGNKVKTEPAGVSAPNPIGSRPALTSRPVSLTLSGAQAAAEGIPGARPEKGASAPPPGQAKPGSTLPAARTAKRGTQAKPKAPSRKAPSKPRGAAAKK